MRDFGDFMRAREQAADAYVNGDGGPVDALTTDTAPASFFGPDGGVVEDPAAVRAAYRSGAQLFMPGGDSRLVLLDARASGDIAYWYGIQGDPRRNQDCGSWPAASTTSASSRAI